MLTPKNWASFQHYKDRAPAWIKLHRGILDDFEFSRLPLASRALAPLLWLLASEYEEGKITASTEELAFRLRITDAELREALKPLIDAGFFISDSTMLAARKQEAIPEERRDTREEIQEEIDICAVANATRTTTEKDFEEFWKAYPKRDGANPKAPARKAFFTAIKRGHQATEIVAGAKKYAAAPSTKGDTQFVAQAVTWLNQERWKDYPEEREKTYAELHPGWRPGMRTHEEILADVESNRGREDQELQRQSAESSEIEDRPPAIRH